MKRILHIALALLVFLALILGARAWRLDSQATPSPSVTSLRVSVDAEAARLSVLVRQRAVSETPARADTAAFLALHDTLSSLYPRVAVALQREVVADLSLLFSWPGSDPDLPPLLLLGHLDTVPADTQDTWTHDPFGGVVSDGVVWGRGAIDDRSNVAGILGAAEGLLAQDFRPRRTILIAFGHDEEVGGWFGARAMASLLEERAVRPFMVLDEGGFVTHGAIPGVDRPVAVVGVAEKGSVTFDLTARAQGGHSSIPPANGAVSQLAEALRRLEDHPMPARLDGPTWSLFRATTPHMSAGLRVVFANRWLFSPVIKRVLAATPVTDATVRTTTAFTLLHAGQKENVVPDRATATVNFRLLPGDAVGDVADHIASTIRNAAVEVTPREGALEASPVSPSQGPAWDLLAGSIQGTFAAEGVVVAPYLVVGGTDARRYTALSDNVYRFQPVEITPAEGTLLHATDERLSVAAMAKVVSFYAALMEASSAR